MKIEILDEAQEDLIQGFRFYERLGVGSYFLDCLFSDIDSLMHFIQSSSVSPFPFTPIPVCDLLQGCGRSNQRSRRAGLSQKSVVDQEAAEELGVVRGGGMRNSKRRRD